ncbi:MAG TPA: FkbM family methyltransferase, partial [Pyrinomonadaceae bacterium]|nr:FkbM family methyltransferase [Pyrinomonadaceae bacterium]
AALLEHADELLAGRFEAAVEDCRLRRLSSVIREEQIEQIDLLKIDVQRAELDVLRGIDSDDWNRIKQVVLEVHDRKGSESEGRAEEIRELLQTHGFAVVVEQDELLSGTDRYNVYAVRPELKAARNGGPANSVVQPVVTTVTASELRRHAGQKLPEYMVPVDYVLLESLPLTANGKVDRRALPEPEAVQAGNEVEKASTPTEELLCGIWSEVLGRAESGVTENFFESGGHSLLATQLISRVREIFAVELPLRTLFEAPTVRELATRVDHALQSGTLSEVPPLKHVSREEALPLSFAQQRLWFLAQLEPENAFYNSPLAVRLKGELKVKALEQTLAGLIKRHEVLRTSFVVEQGKPRQVIGPVEAPLTIIELDDLEESEREAAVRELAVREAAQPFDLSRGPLLRVKLVRMSEQEHVLLLTMHHIVSDGWSMGVLIREVSELYSAFASGQEPKLEELPIQYADYASWQREWLQGEVLEEQVQYWR